MVLLALRTGTMKQNTDMRYPISTHNKKDTPNFGLKNKE